MSRRRLLEDGWCINCLDDFRYDDCGGYNPPCDCGLHCRSCHDAIEARNAERCDEDDIDREEWFGSDATEQAQPAPSTLQNSKSEEFR